MHRSHTNKKSKDSSSLIKPGEMFSNENYINEPKDAELKRETITLIKRLKGLKKMGKNTSQNLRGYQ